MPCDQIRTCTVKLEAANRDVLKKAIAKLGWKIISEYSGILEVQARGVSMEVHRDHVEVRRGYEFLADELKVAYSLTGTEEKAEANQWKFQQTEIDATLSPGAKVVVQFEMTRDSWEENSQYESQEYN